jgi:hypothetical protein
LVARAFGLPVIAVHLPRMLGIHPFSAFGIRWAPAAKGDPCIVIDWGSSGSGPHSFPAILTYLAGPLSLLVLGFLFFSAFRDRRTGLPFVVALCLVLGLGLMGSAAWDLYPRAPVGRPHPATAIRSSRPQNTRFAGLRRDSEFRGAAGGNGARLSGMPPAPWKGATLLHRGSPKARFIGRYLPAHAVGDGLKGEYRLTRGSRIFSIARPRGLAVPFPLATTLSSGDCGASAIASARGLAW